MKILRRLFLPLVLMGVTIALLGTGCISYSQEKASQNMKNEEKEMLAKLSSIPKGMPKGEVEKLLGPGQGSPNGDTWLYYINARGGGGTPGYIVPGMTLPTVSNGQFTGGTVSSPTLYVPGSGETAKFDSVARVFFKNDRVTKIDFTAPMRWHFYVVK